MIKKIILALICICFYSVIVSKTVESAGVTTVSIPLTTSGLDGDIYCVPNATWTNCTNDATGTMNITDTTTGNSSLPTVSYLGVSTWRELVSIIGFPLTTLPAGVEIVGARLKLYTIYLYDVVNPPTYTLYMGAYRFSKATTTIALSDYVASGVLATSLVSEVSDTIPYSPNIYVTYTFTASGLSYLTNPDVIGGIKYIWLQMKTTNQASVVEPSGFTANPGDFLMRNEWYTADNASPNKPLLEIDYTTVIAPIEDIPPIPIINAPTCTLLPVSSNPVTVAWLSPKSAYANELITFVIQGVCGSPIKLSLRDKLGKELSTITDSIRSDGNYFWYVHLANTDIDSFARVIEINTNTTSKWGYISPKPDTNQANLQIGSVYTASSTAQYVNTFDKYTATKSSYFPVHWKVNIGSGEYATNYFAFDYLGSNLNTYTASMSWVTSTYLADSNLVTATITSQRSNMNGNQRFMLFTFDGSQTGFNNYDGMIIDLAKPYNVSVSGFYKPKIYNQTLSQEITNTVQKGEWYLINKSDYILFSLDRGSYSMPSTIKISLNISDDSGIKTYLNRLEYQLVSSNGTVINNGTDTISKNLNNYNLGVLLLPSGSYKVRLILSSSLHNFRYIQDIPIKISGDITDLPLPTDIPAVEPPFDITELLKKFGMDTSFFHWIIMIFVAVVLFVITRKHELLRVILALSPFAVGLVLGWIDLWIIIVLGIGAGLAIYNLVGRNKGGE